MRPPTRVRRTRWLMAAAIAGLTAAGCSETSGPRAPEVQVVAQPLSAGGVASCGISDAGSVYCWGGYEPAHPPQSGSFHAQPLPTPVAPGLRFVHVSTDQHTCALTVGGVAYCWGQNWAGQLGDGTTADRLQPTLVSGPHVFVQISVGVLHTCGLTPAGAAYCWGSGWNGELGNGAQEPQSTPTAVGGDRRFRWISAGLRYTCGIESSGTASCWGANDWGQLGSGEGDDRTSPTAVDGGLRFERISAGIRHACGLTPEGAAYCWGRNELGALGTGTTETLRDRPAAVADGPAFAQITAGSEYTCALTHAGAAYCWGAGGQGNALGNGSWDEAPTPVPVAGGHAFTRISAGVRHTLATTADGAPYAWGTNFHGQLGDGTQLQRDEPTPAAAALRFP